MYESETYRPLSLGLRSCNCVRMKNPPAWQSRAVGLKIRESNRLSKYSARPYQRKCALDSYNNNPARNSEGKLTWSEEYTLGFVESNGVPGNSAGSVPRRSAESPSAV